MTVSSSARWIGIALLGLAVAVAVAIAGSRLVSRQIGLASEPLDAGDKLAPHLGVRRPPRARSRPHARPAAPVAPTPPEPAAPEPSGVEPAPEAPPPAVLSPEVPHSSGDGGGRAAGEGGGGSDD